MGHPNISWREQAKAVVCLKDDERIEYKSVWEAASAVASTMLCKHETAKKEIRRAIKTGVCRYGCKWRWKE